MVLRWYGGSKVVRWFWWYCGFFSFFLVCKYSFILRQWVSVREGCGSKSWLVLDLVYFLVVLLLRLT